jgi:ribosomal protein S16
MSINIGNEFKEGSLFNPTVGFRYKLKKGGPIKKELPDDYNNFLNFNKTLPSNLQDPNFEYGNPNHYDLYGLWESLGKSKDFNQAVKNNPDWQPDEEDGLYHGFTVNTNGVFLKPANHPTTYKEVMMASLNTDPYFKENTIIMNEDGRLQYVPRKKNGGTMNEQLMQQVQQMIEQGASKGDVAQQLMAAVQEGQLDQESVMQVFQQLGITEQDLQQVQQPQQPSEAQQQVMALGGMPRFPNGGQPSPEEMAMMQQQQAQQQGAPQEQQQGGGDQMQQVMQMVQQMVQQGAQPVDIVQALLQNQLPPEAIMQVLTQMGMEPEEAQATIQQVMQGGQQQPQQQQGPGEEQVEGESSNPEEEEEEQQELPQQAFGSQLKKLISNHSKSELTSEVDSDIHSATRNLKFANTLRKNAHEAMLNEAFDFPSLKNNSNSNSLPQAAWGDDLKALQDKYKDDAEYKKYLDEQKAYTDWKTNQGQQGQGQGQPGVNNIYYVNDPRGGGSQSTYQNPGAFSRLFNNSGWTSDRLGFDFSNLPLSNDPDAKYNVTAITPEKGILGRRKVRYDINWGTTPNDASTTGTGATGTTPAVEPLSDRQIRRGRRKFDNEYEDALDEKIDGVNKNQSKADQFTDKWNAANDLINSKESTKFKDQVNPYDAPNPLLAEKYFEGDDNISRRDIKGYYKEAYPNMPRKDVRQLARESAENKVVIGTNSNYEIPASQDDANGIGDFFRNTAYNVRTGISNAFGHLSNKSYGGLIQAGPGINMEDPMVRGYSTDEDKPATALNQKGSVTVKEKFKLDKDAFADASKLTADTISSSLNRADLQERANDPEQYSAVNRFSPTAYSHASSGLYDEQGNFKPNNVGATTIFNPTNAEGSFYKQLFALGGGVNKITFTDEELQVLKDAGYNTDDLI